MVVKILKQARSTRITEPWKTLVRALLEEQQFTKFFVKIIVVIVLYGVAWRAARYARTIVAMLVRRCVTMLICLFKTLKLETS